ncbi:MAG: hypothetical protein Q4C83_01215 [Candidatus Saccharibacteria bacterium]|nr:hypothetical protein [Candidatus Saccharibacteria bacterium]
MKNDSPEKQLLAKIKSVTNILVTVSRNPSVDELVSALGLTIALNKMDKRSVAVFSGKIPPVINFLKPEKTFENNADSLRDFIISLSKDKADRLKVRPEGDFVKVYITPYRTKITPDDLKFSDGDFNIELIIAIGVADRNELDAAIASHGKIFHNATTATLNIGSMHDGLGMISWQDGKYGCYAEMCYELARDLSTNDKQLVDGSVATALLTGVVSATDQFRNGITTPAIMTLAASLMSKGADQQLITSELEGKNEVDFDSGKRRDNDESENSDDDNVVFSHDDYKRSNYDDIADPIARRLQEDRDDFGHEQSLEALRAAQGQLLADTGAIDGNNRVSVKSSPVSQSSPESAPKPVEQLTPATPAAPQVPEAPMVTSVKQPEPVPQVSSDNTSNPVPTEAVMAAVPVAPATPTESAVPIAPVAPTVTPAPAAPVVSISEQQRPQYVDDPLSRINGLPNFADGATTQTSSGSYLINNDENNPVITEPSLSNNLPFNQPNQVSPITNPVMPANALPMPDLAQPLPTPAMALPPVPPAPISADMANAMPPQINQPTLAQPALAIEPTPAVNQPAVADLQAPIPAAASVTVPAPAPAAVPNDPSQFVIPS